MKRRDGSVEHALEIAAYEHKGQLDKVGAPYILHPLRVASRVLYHEGPHGEGIPALGLDLPAFKVAILHDVLEDSDVVASDLLYEGFSEDEVGAIALLTRPAAGTPDRPTYADYIRRVRDAEGEAGRIARRVKMADLRDNLSRIDDLPPEEQSIEKRYKKATAILLGIME